MGDRTGCGSEQGHLDRAALHSVSDAFQLRSTDWTPTRWLAKLSSPLCSSAAGTCSFMRACMSSSCVAHACGSEDGCDHAGGGFLFWLFKAQQCPGWRAQHA